MQPVTSATVRDDLGINPSTLFASLELSKSKESVRAEFLKSYPADSYKAKGMAFLRCEKLALAGGRTAMRRLGLEEEAATFGGWEACFEHPLATRVVTPKAYPWPLWCLHGGRHA
jgi:hypothetical protein